jgi:hypothetical protein
MQLNRYLKVIFVYIYYKIVVKVKFIYVKGKLTFETI